MGMGLESSVERQIHVLEASTEVLADWTVVVAGGGGQEGFL